MSSEPIKFDGKFLSKTENDLQASHTTYVAAILDTPECTLADRFASLRGKIADAMG